VHIGGKEQAESSGAISLGPKWHAILLN